ncbi:hypothetical protein JOD55_000407 [Arcanobacterium pluranimalium]|uniref:hypothetical protein n=1 Tax=Arcanobacterium pluranimalium TaxID=108028 RepID=UPI0019592FC0|nr:hypothetical protein [Arcanobacterium pluranimalium]MBM7824580.1 hypothetical protein [Arcanobacterium pluranimalium]
MPGGEHAPLQGATVSQESNTSTPKRGVSRKALALIVAGVLALIGLGGVGIYHANADTRTARTAYNSAIEAQDKALASYTKAYEDAAALAKDCATQVDDTHVCDELTQALGTKLTGVGVLNDKAGYDSFIKNTPLITDNAATLDKTAKTLGDLTARVNASIDRKAYNTFTAAWAAHEQSLNALNGVLSATAGKVADANAYNNATSARDNATHLREVKPEGRDALLKAASDLDTSRAYMDQNAAAVYATHQAWAGAQAQAEAQAAQAAAQQRTSTPATKRTARAGSGSGSGSGSGGATSGSGSTGGSAPAPSAPSTSRNKTIAPPGAPIPPTCTDGQRRLPPDTSIKGYIECRGGKWIPVYNN